MPPSPTPQADRPEADLRRLGLVTATSLVVASMIGAGVFITSGKLLNDIPSPLGILVCWLVGGVAALCGALSYAELAAAMPHNGGEYHFLSRLVHPAVGFLSAWSALIVGFAAPLAAVALAFGSYLQALWPALDPRLAGSVLIVALTLVNVWRVRAGSGLQNVFTIGKVLLIVGFVAVGAPATRPSLLVVPQPPLGSTVLSGGFAVGLLWVSFAYTGWNASAYVAGELREPERVLPRALIAGTALVTLLYLAINLVFLTAAPVEALRDQVAVGHVAATHLLGPRGGRVMTLIIALGLVSTIGAMIVTGPRIYEAVGRDLPRLGWLATRRPEGGPIVATALQSGLALAMMQGAGIDALMTYIGFTLSLFAALAVGSLFRARHLGIHSPFRTPGYPVTPALFIALMAWMIVWGLVQTPRSALAGLATIASGLVIYLFGGKRATRE